MSRPLRYTPGGLVFRVLNRGVGRRALFTNDEDFLAFERVVEETLRTCPMRISAYCLMSNHWHFILCPERDGQLAAFMQQMTNMHVKRWKEHRREIGYGHLYHGRYKCFPIDCDDYFYQAVRYVERNALRAETWRWSSLRRSKRDEPGFPLVSSWPLPRPADWLRIVNEPQTEAELESFRRCVHRGSPYGSSSWVAQVARTLGLESTLRPCGRPTKEQENAASQTMHIT